MIPYSEDNIGVLAGPINIDAINVEVPDIKRISFFDFIQCNLYYKDSLGNPYSEFDLKQSKDKYELEVINVFSNDKIKMNVQKNPIDKYGKTIISIQAMLDLQDA